MKTRKEPRVVRLAWKDKVDPPNVETAKSNVSSARSVREARKERARMLTVQRQMELAERKGGK